MTEGYSYPAKNRLSRPEDIEDLGAIPTDFFTKKTPAPEPEPAEAATSAPSRGLARRKRTPQAVPDPPTTTVDDPDAPRPSEPPTGDTPVRARKGAHELHRPSSANLPLHLVNAVAKHREKTSLSAGDIVIEAIAHTLEQLPDLLAEASPETHVGGFVARPPAAPDEGPTKLFAFRLIGTNFDKLDALVQQLGARDRTHLIKEALTAYFKE